ncbi:MAG: redoxin domain-containing protein [Planctomycetota bacterium]|nr:redoxin domain-containing protein [Planctomycetota bacterium]
MRDSGELIKKFDVAYFAASCDSVEKNTRFAKSLNADYPILSDPDKSVATAMGVLHPNGKFSARHTVYIGKDGVIRHIQKKVNVTRHAEEIASKLKELDVPAR